MPFFTLLGYYPNDPDEVFPEADASFSDKFKNRVDYAIYREGDPVIAVETKKVGTLLTAFASTLRPAASACQHGACSALSARSG